MYLYELLVEQQKLAIHRLLTEKKLASGRYDEAVREYNRVKAAMADARKHAKDERRRNTVKYVQSKMDELCEVYAEKLGVEGKIELMRPGKNKRELAEMRMAIWYILRIDYKLLWMDIGQMFNRDHATVISGVDKARELLSHRKPDPQMLRYVEAASAAIYQTLKGLPRC